MKYFSLVGKSLLWIGFLLFSCMIASVKASDMVSGIQLKEHVKSVLLTRGLESQPVISGSRRFRACKAPLQVKPMFGGYKTVRLICPDVDGFKLAVRTQIDKNFDTETGPANSEKDRVGLAKFVVLTKSMQRGEIIGADDVVLVNRNANPGVGYFRDIGDVVGRKAKRTININQIIRARHLELAYAIQKDQSVIIETKIGLVTVLSAGIAVADAQVGERIKVKNNSSGLVVEGIAISGKKIRIRAK